MTKTFQTNIFFFCVKTQNNFHKTTLMKMNSYTPRLYKKLFSLNIQDHFFKKKTMHVKFI